MANDVEVEVEEAEKYCGGTKRQNLDLSFFRRVWLSSFLLQGDIIYRVRR
jgi:hypothetical protein